MPVKGLKWVSYRIFWVKN